MPLSPEQQHLISNRIRADSPSPAPAYLLWLFLGFLGAHRFYLKRAFSGGLMAALLILGLSLAAIGIIFGGTPLDGIFFMPDVGDILRASQSRQGAYLFYGGAAMLACLLCRWAADGFAIGSFIRAARAAKQRDLAEFFQAY